MKFIELVNFLESMAPLSLQESYDNSGVQIGNPDSEISSALLCLDITEEVLDEAMNKKANLIISHHPLIFGSIKSLTGKNFIERIILKAIKNDIAIYAMHTNIDNLKEGVSNKMCDKLELENRKILSPQKGGLKKLVTFVPNDHTELVRKAIFEAGAGHIGNYDYCSYNLEGEGTFRAQEGSNPFVGKQGKIHIEKEVRIETIFPAYLQKNILIALKKSHPYEEVAYDIYPLDNKNSVTGSGMIGELKVPTKPKDFFDTLKKVFNASYIRHSPILTKEIKKVALCGGSGAFLIPQAKQQKADIFITGDIKYHQFFEAENQLILADIGHYESEQFTMEIFYDKLSKKFPNFATHFSETNTNPINYY